MLFLPRLGREFRDPIHPQLLQVPWGSAPCPIPGIFCPVTCCKGKLELLPCPGTEQLIHPISQPPWLPFQTYPGAGKPGKSAPIAPGLCLSHLSLFSLCCCSRISGTLVGFVLSVFFWSQEGGIHFQAILGTGRACCCAPWGFWGITSLTKLAEAAASAFPEIPYGFVLSHPGHRWFGIDWDPDDHNPYGWEISFSELFYCSSSFFQVCPISPWPSGRIFPYLSC